jgi:hypothetical protein
MGLNMLQGVAYSANYGSGETPVDPGSISRLDPLANAAGCTRDIPFFKQLGEHICPSYINFKLIYPYQASMSSGSTKSTRLSRTMPACLPSPLPAFTFSSI